MQSSNDLDGCRKLLSFIESSLQRISSEFYQFPNDDNSDVNESERKSFAPAVPAVPAVPAAPAAPVSSAAPAVPVALTSVVSAQAVFFAKFSRALLAVYGYVGGANGHMGVIDSSSRLDRFEEEVVKESGSRGAGEDVEESNDDDAGSAHNLSPAVVQFVVEVCRRVRRLVDDIRLVKKTLYDDVVEPLNDLRQLSVPVDQLYHTHLFNSAHPLSSNPAHPLPSSLVNPLPTTVEQLLLYGPRKNDSITTHSSRYNNTPDHLLRPRPQGRRDVLNIEDTQQRRRHRDVTAEKVLRGRESHDVSTRKRIGNQPPRERHVTIATQITARRRPDDKQDNDDDDTSTRSRQVGYRAKAILDEIWLLINGILNCFLNDELGGQIKKKEEDIRSGAQLSSLVDPSGPGVNVVDPGEPGVRVTLDELFPVVSVVPTLLRYMWIACEASRDWIEMTARQLSRHAVTGMNDVNNNNDADDKRGRSPMRDVPSIDFTTITTKPTTSLQHVTLHDQPQQATSHNPQQPTTIPIKSSHIHSQPVLPSTAELTSHQPWGLVPRTSNLPPSAAEAEAGRLPPPDGRTIRKAWRVRQDLQRASMEVLRSRKHLEKIDEELERIEGEANRYRRLRHIKVTEKQYKHEMMEFLDISIRQTKKTTDDRKVKGRKGGGEDGESSRARAGVGEGTRPSERDVRRGLGSRGAGEESGGCNGGGGNTAATAMVLKRSRIDREVRLLDTDLAELKEQLADLTAAARDRTQARLEAADRLEVAEARYNRLLIDGSQTTSSGSKNDVTLKSKPEVDLRMSQNGKTVAGKETEQVTMKAQHMVTGKEAESTMMTPQNVVPTVYGKVKVSRKLPGNKLRGDTVHAEMHEVNKGGELLGRTVYDTTFTRRALIDAKIKKDGRSLAKLSPIKPKTEKNNIGKVIIIDRKSSNRKSH